MTLCPICQKENGALLLDRRLRKTFEHFTIDPKGVCDKCKKQYLSVGVLLINPQTGSLLILKDSAFKRLFSIPIPVNKITFAEEEVIDRITKESEKSTHEKPIE